MKIYVKCIVYNREIKSNEELTCTCEFIGNEVIFTRLYDKYDNFDIVYNYGVIEQCNTQLSIPPEQLYYFILDSFADDLKETKACLSYIQKNDYLDEWSETERILGNFNNKQHRIKYEINNLKHLLRYFDVDNMTFKKEEEDEDEDEDEDFYGGY